jgi:hypothetical protein
MSSQMVFWMVPPQLGLAAPMVVGSSLVKNRTVSRALTAWAGAAVGSGTGVVIAGAAVAVACIPSSAGRATVGAVVGSVWTSGAGGAEVPQATSNRTIRATTLDRHFIIPFFDVELGSI